MEWRVRGGIFGLLQLLRQYGEAVEYELLTVGLRLDQLGTKRLTWRDLKVVVACSPPGGALHRAIDPEAAQWDPSTYLIAQVVDLLNAGNWQRAGNKHLRHPDPVWRPHQAQKKRKGRNLTALAQKTQAADGR